MAAADSQSFWMSAKIPNDAFLQYGFDGVSADLEQALAVVRRNVTACPELLVRIDDSNAWRYPCWVPYDVTADWGTEYDFFGEEAHQDYNNLKPEVAKNRQLLKSTMERHGFNSIRTEWWHYSYGQKSYTLDGWVWPCRQHQ